MTTPVMTYDPNSGRAFTALLRNATGDIHYGHITILFDRNWKSRTAEQQQEMWELFKSYQGRNFRIHTVDERRPDQRSVRFKSDELAAIRAGLIAKIKERTPGFVFDASRDRTLEHFHSELNPDVAEEIGIGRHELAPIEPFFTFVPATGFKTKECHFNMIDYKA